MSEVMHRRVAAHDLTVANGSATSTTTNRPARRKVRKRRRKKSAFQSHYGQQRQKEFLLLVMFGAFLMFLMGMVVYRIAFARTSSRNVPYEQEDPVDATKTNQQQRPGFWKSIFSGGRYAIPGAMSAIGDKSAAYAALREDYDGRYPEDPERSRSAVKELHKHTYQVKPMEESDKKSYDVFNCPHDPPIGYPYAWNIMEVLKSWPPDDPTPRSHIYQGLCVFDYERDYETIVHYRTLEVPYVVQNDPEVARTVERWNAPGYMERLMGGVPHRVEYSENNHFMYWVPPRPGKKGNANNNNNNKKGPNALVRVEKPNNWTAPTKMSRMPYKEWLHHANTTDEFLGPDQPHWYYRLIGCGDGVGKCDRDSSEYLFDELTFFQPKEPSLYLKEIERQKGIHCRFGMKGVIAENHFDGSRNSIVVLGGSRRYILSHPNQCERLALLPKGHPSGRHSAVDWSNPDYASYPQFKTAEVNEIVMQAGDVLYLPTNWFHYIISLELNFQCNTRSGISGEYMEPIHECGF